MNKRQDLLAKYLADLSKIFFSAVIVRQFVERQVNPLKLFIGLSSAIILFVIAYFVHPKE
jgi:hypothetical protein